MASKRDYPASSYIKKQNTSDANQPNEVRVKVGNKHFSYASYAGKQLLVAKSDFVYLTAAGAAVSNAIRVIEYLKRHVRGLHVQYKILSKKFIDEYLPTIEGLDKVTTERIVSTLECVLTITKGDQIKGTAGYATATTARCRCASTRAPRCSPGWPACATPSPATPCTCA